MPKKYEDKGLLFQIIGQTTVCKLQIYYKVNIGKTNVLQIVYKYISVHINPPDADTSD